MIFLFLGSVRSRLTSVARSSTETEYHAMATTAIEIVWMCWLLMDLGASSFLHEFIYSNSKIAIHIAHSFGFQERTRHAEI